MIYYCIPYSTNKDIGKSYNDFMALLPDDNDFACFVDGDTIFTTSDYGHTIQQAVNTYYNVNCFTCFTNRVRCKEQVLQGINYESNDIEYHRLIGQTMQTIYGATCKDVTRLPNNNYMSGVMILLRKKLWKKIGGFAEGGMLGIDNRLHKSVVEAGERVYLMQGVYLYHWYRWPDKNDKSHLL